MRWAERQKNIYISEYSMPESRFRCVWERKKTMTLAAAKNGYAVERLFIPKGNEDEREIQLSMF